MDASAVRALVARHLEDEKTHDGKRAASSYTGDGTYWNVPLDLRFTGRDAVAAQYDASYGAFPDLGVRIEGDAVEGGRLVHWGTFHGTVDGEFLGQPPTGRRVEVPFVAVFECADGAIRGEAIYFDLASLAEQAGYPLDALRAAAENARAALRG